MSEGGRVVKSPAESGASLGWGAGPGAQQGRCGRAGDDPGIHMLLPEDTRGQAPRDRSAPVLGLTQEAEAGAARKCLPTASLCPCHPPASREKGDRVHSTIPRHQPVVFHSHF